jgi:hypothetical protein
MSDLFVGSFTNYLASSPTTDTPLDASPADLDGAFDFVETEHDTNASQLPMYETPAPSDGGWLASQGMRPAMMVASSDDEHEDHVAGLDAGEGTDDDDDSESADELGDAGVARDAATEWKIDHSSGDHRLHGMAPAPARVGAR